MSPVPADEGVDRALDVVTACVYAYGYRDERDALDVVIRRLRALEATCTIDETEEGDR